MRYPLFCSYKSDGKNYKKMKLFCSYKSDGFWWFRIFGYGLCGKDLTKHFLLFSERHGYTKTIKLGKWSIKLLKPNKS